MRAGSLVCGSVAALTAWAPFAHATEGAGSNVTLGALTFGTPVFPDPGIYYTSYYNYYTSKQLNDGNGKKLFSGLSINANVQYNQLFYATPLTYAGFKFGVGAVTPLAAVGQRIPGADKFVTGMGDTLIQPLVIGWDHDRFHAILVQGVFVPTGEYKPSDLLSLGRNTWQYQPQLSLGYLDPNGFETTTTMSYVISSVNTRPLANFANPANAHYRSGQEFAADFAAGWNLTPHFEAGLSGYAYVQTTGDKLTGVAANADFQAAFQGYRGETVGLGPAVRYLTPYGEFFLHYQKELYAINRTLGNSLWFRVNLKF